MKPNQNLLSTVLQPRDKIEVSKILTELEAALTDSSNFISRMEINERTRGCYWAGQSDDGRKHADDLGEDATPWEGSSDQRIPLARMLCTEAKLVATTALAAGLMQGEGVDNADDTAAAASQAPMMKWLRSGRMRREMRDEADFLIDWQNTYGHSILMIDWHQKRGLKEETLTFDQLLSMAVTMGLMEAGLPDAAGLEELAAAGALPPDVAETSGVVMSQTTDHLMMIIQDPTKKFDLIELVDAALNPDGQTVLSVPPKEVRRVATALQKGEPGVYYRPWLCENRPSWRALLPMVDVFYPAHTTTLEKAEWIAVVHWLSMSRFKDRAELEGWDEEVMEAALEKPGNCYSSLLSKKSWVLAGSAVQRGVSKDRLEQSSQYQIIELFQVATAQTGTPCLYRTVLHPGVTSAPLLHEPLASLDAAYPCIELRRNREGSRYLMDSEGIPEQVLTHQNAIKAQHDGRTNRTDLELMPPASVPMNRAGGNFILGPNAQIPVRRSGTIEWLRPPPMSMDTVAITNDEWALVNRIFGRMSDDVPAALTQLHTGKLVTDFLTDISSAFQKTYNLCLVNFDEETWMRICNTPKPAPDPYQHDMGIVFDVRNLDLDWIKQLVEVYNNLILPADSEAVLNRAEYVKYLVQSLTPQLADRFVRKQEEANTGEMEDEQVQLAIIMGGDEPPQKAGQNYQLRLQVLQRAMQNSQEVQKKIAENPQIREVLEARIKFFQNQLQQRQNAIIGRTMRQPVMGEGGPN